MFCPKCATQNPESSSFCRGCGANISLIPQAMNGQPPQTQEPPELEQIWPASKRNKALTLEPVFKNIAMGVAFLIIAIALSRTGQGWWFWMLIPAFTMVSKGLYQYTRYNDYVQSLSMQPPQPNRVLNTPPQRSVAEMPRRNTGELMPPVASVTEGTTRHLGVEAPTRHLENDR